MRKVFFDKMDMKVTDYVEELGQTLGEALLTPTRIYADACDAVLPKFDIKGIVHITGGGFFENIIFSFVPTPSVPDTSTG